MGQLAGTHVSWDVILLVRLGGPRVIQLAQRLAARALHCAGVAEATRDLNDASKHRTSKASGFAQRPFLVVRVRRIQRNSQAGVSAILSLDVT